MDETVVRLLVVAAIGLTAVVFSILARRGVAVRRTAYEPTGLAAGIHLFTSRSCLSCERAHAVLVASGHEFAEHPYETEGDLHTENGIERVPAIVWVPGSATGRSAWIASGVPSARILRRWLGP